MKKMTTIAIFLFMISMAGGAMAALELASFAPRVSYVMPSELDAALGFGAVVGLGDLTETIGLEVTADYWKSNIENVDAWDVKNLVVGVRGRYDIPTEGSAVPYVVGGAAMNFLSYDYDPGPLNYDLGEPDLFGMGSTSESETKVGIDAGAGVEFPGESMSFFAEGTYRTVHDFSGITIGGGVKFNLTK